MRRLLVPRVSIFPVEKSEPIGIVSIFFFSPSFLSVSVVSRKSGQKKKKKEKSGHKA